MAVEERTSSRRGASLPPLAARLASSRRSGANWLKERGRGAARRKLATTEEEVTSLDSWPMARLRQGGDGRVVSHRKMCRVRSPYTIALPKPYGGTAAK